MPPRPPPWPCCPTVVMSRAAQGLAQVAAARLEDSDEATVVGLVGAGDNGGDTLYAVGLLSEAGFPCAVVLLPPSGREGVHADGLAAAESAGVMVHVAADDPAAAVAVVAEADLVLDGIVGIGGRPGLRPEAAALVDAVDDDAWVIAVDVASGLDPEGESDDHDAVWADETVTFGTPKPAHLLPAGEAATGRLTVIDIGVDVTDVPAAVERLTWDDVAALWPVPSRGDDKYSRGVLGVVAGGESYSGAAVLSVTAAVEAGVGMVRYVGTPTPTGLVRAAVPEAVMGDGRVQAWVIGPGLDVTATGPEAQAQVAVARAALASDLPVVIDAGGLDLIEGWRDAPTVVTPHAGEPRPSAGTDGPARRRPRRGRDQRGRRHGRPTALRPRPRRPHRRHRAAQGSHDARRQPRGRAGALPGRRAAVARHGGGGRRALRRHRRPARDGTLPARRGLARRTRPRCHGRPGLRRWPAASARRGPRHTTDGARPVGPGTVRARVSPAPASRTRSPAPGPPRRTARLNR